MKIFERLCVATVLWAALLEPASGVRGAETAVIRDRRVNVRGQASLMGEVVTQLKQGDTITILEEVTVAKPKKGEPGKWLRIALPANTPVWINTSFIDATAKTVIPNRLNFRAGPGENYSVLGRLEKGALVKEISQKENWTEIEAPTNAYAFIAANLATAGADGEPSPAEIPPVVKSAPPILTPVPTPLTPVAETPPPVVAPPPVIPPPPVVERQPPPAETRPVILPPVATPPPAAPAKRMVRREGIVKSTLSIQAPTYYELRSADTGKTINYLHTTSTNLSLKGLKDRRIFVTGEELMDPRWKDAPLLEIETIELVP